MIPLYKVFMAKVVDADLLQVLHSGYIGEGAKVKEFEAALSGWFKHPGEPGPNVLCTNSCTSALHLAFHLVNEPTAKGDRGEILASPLTCFAGISAIIHNGFRIRWVDVNDDGNVDLDDLKRKITPSSKAIFVTHFAGQPADIYKIYNLANEHGLRVVEDCAHALGSKYYNLRLGGFNHPLSIQCFSFQAVKPLTTVDGGAIIVPPELQERARKLRWYGIDRNQERFGQEIVEPGYKFHMNDVAATIGLGNMQHLDDLLDVQDSNRNALLFELQNNSDFHPLHIYSTAFRSRCSVFPVWAEDRMGFERAMKERGIEAAPPHELHHEHLCLAQFWEHLPGAAKLRLRLSALPAGWWVKPEDRQHIVEAVKAGW